MNDEIQIDPGSQPREFVVGQTFDVVMNINVMEQPWVATIPILRTGYYRLALVPAEVPERATEPVEVE